LKSPPRYQTLERRSIPVVALAGGAGSMRVIAGELQGTKGAARTFTPIILWEGSLRAGVAAELPVPEGFNAAVFVRSGVVNVEGSALQARQLAVMSQHGAGVRLQAHGSEDAQVIVLGGQPIDEPVIAYGPFVMNTQAEIAEAVQDYRSGRMGTLAS
jgi:redox-sensitive bicupin YhaK (pirin superfamily)